MDAPEPFELLDDPPSPFDAAPESFAPESFAPESLEPAPPDPPEPSLDGAAPLESDAAEALVLELLELARSFFAQPEPLKCTDGATKTFRSVSSAPQAGQNFGAGASMPWMNSVRVEQVEQT